MFSASTLVLALVTAGSYLVVRSLYRLYFHPLSRYPGPKLAAISHVYEFYYDVIKGGTFLFHIGELHEKYGPIVRINPRELHINDASFYDEIYASSARPRDKDPVMVNIFASPSSMVATTNHDAHRFRRGILNSYFSKRSVNDLAPVIEERVLKLMDRLREKYENKDIIQLDLAFAGLTADIITRYAYGKSWGFLEDPEFHSEIRTAVGESMATVHVNRFFPVVWKVLTQVPLWVMALLMPGKAKLFRFQQEIFDHSASFVKQRTSTQQPVDTRESSSTSTGRKGRPTIFEKLTDPQLPPEERTLARVRDEAFVLLIAGTETTARALTLASFHLASNPGMWARLREEVKSVLPSPESTATWAELERLPYLAGTVNEALRLSFGLIVRLPRIAPTEALRYKDYVIPPGTPLSMSTYFANQDPTLFPDPQRFNPDRWLHRDAEERLGRHLVSFTKGSRACLGMNLAYLELFMTIAYFVRRFDIELHDTTAEDLRLVREFGMGMTRRGEVHVFARVKDMAE